MEPRTAVQAGECLQPSPDLILHYDEKISILLSRGSNIDHGSGGKKHSCDNVFFHGSVVF